MSDNTSDLLEQFLRLEWLLLRYHRKNRRFFGPMGDPRRGQGRVLALLKLKPEMSQKELSDILDIRSQSLGELLAKLERSGYIERTPSQTDRRVMDIRLTDKGKEAAGQSEKIKPASDELFACLKKEEQAELSGYLCRIISALEQQFANDGPEPDFRERPFLRSGGFGFDPRLGRRPPFDGHGFGPHHPFGHRGFGPGFGYDPFDDEDGDGHTEKGPDDSEE